MSQRNPNPPNDRLNHNTNPNQPRFPTTTDPKVDAAQNGIKWQLEQEARRRLVY